MSKASVKPRAASGKPHIGLRKRGGQPGNPGPPPEFWGRRHGAINHITRDLKQGIMHGAIKYGRDGKGKDGLEGFFEFLVRNHLDLYLPFLLKLLPAKIVGDVDVDVNHGPVTVKVVAVPNDHYLSAEQIKALQQPHLAVDNPAAATVVEDTLAYSLGAADEGTAPPIIDVEPPAPPDRDSGVEIVTLGRRRQRQWPPSDL